MREFSIENDFNDQFYKTEAFGIFSEKRDKSWEPHVHHFVEIMYVLNGKADNYINGKLFKISRGDLLVVNYESVHSYEPQGSFEYVNIGIKPELLLKQINNKNAFPFMLLTNFDEIKQNDEQILSFYGEERIQIESLFKVMLLEAKQKGESREFVLESCLHILVSIIIDKLSYTIKDMDHEDWDKLLEFICDNLGEKLSLNELAKMCYYNPSYFSRLFKKKFGVNVSNYIKKQRIEEAKKMLLDDMTIEAIVECLGFSSKHIFYSTFREIVGQSVGEYRRSLKNKLVVKY